MFRHSNADKGYVIIKIRSWTCRPEFKHTTSGCLWKRKKRLVPVVNVFWNYCHWKNIAKKLFQIVAQNIVLLKGYCVVAFITKIIIKIQDVNDGKISFSSVFFIKICVHSDFTICTPSLMAFLKYQYFLVTNYDYYIHYTD